MINKIQYKKNMLILNKKTCRNELITRLKSITNYIEDFQKDINDNKINDFCMSSIQNEMRCIEDCYNNIRYLEQKILLLEELEKEQ